MMSKAIQTVQDAMKLAESIRPKAGGFPYLAEALRQAGVTRNLWELPSCQSMLRTEKGNIVMQGQPLITGLADIPQFDRGALILALRIDQAGESTFLEFLNAAWAAGVVHYDVDFAARTVAYHGVEGEMYIEEYPGVTL